MGDNTTKTTNQESVTAAASPYGSAKPLLDTGMADALSQYNKTKNAMPWDAFMKEGADWTAGRARKAMTQDPVYGALNNWQATFGKDGYNTAQRDALSALAPTTRGDYLDREDPNFERILGRASERAATEASMLAGNMGRYGSGAHQGVVAREVGDMEAGARLGQYNLERDRQLAAIGQQFGMGQAGMGNTAQAGSIYESLYGARNRPAMDLMQLGQTPNAQLADLLAAAQAGQPYATRVAQTSGSGSVKEPSNTGGMIGGGLLAGLSLLGGF
jgi:hypothetical protein